MRENTELEQMSDWSLLRTQNRYVLTAAGTDAAGPMPWSARRMSIVISSDAKVGHVLAGGRGDSQGQYKDSLLAKPHPRPKIPMHAHPKMKVILRPNKSAILPRNRRRHPYGARCENELGYESIEEKTYGAKGVGGDDPLQLGLYNVEVPADGRERDGYGSHIRGLRRRLYMGGDACERGKKSSHSKSWPG